MTMSVEDFRLELATALAQARKSLLAEVTAIKADQNSRGALKSSATVKRLLRAGLGAEKAAVEAALKDLDRAREIAGRSRAAQMRKEIEPQINDFHSWLLEGLGLEPFFAGLAERDSVAKILEDGAAERATILVRYDRGFSRADQKAWSLRHPLLWDLSKMLLGAALGIAGTLVAQALKPHTSSPERTAPSAQAKTPSATSR